MMAAMTEVAFDIDTAIARLVGAYASTTTSFVVQIIDFFIDL